MSNLVYMQSDQIIINAFQAGSQKEQHFTELVKRHQQKLYYQIKRMVIEHADADDIAQIVWMKVWEKLDAAPRHKIYGKLPDHLLPILHG